MRFEFADDYKEWFNSYRVLGVVTYHQGRVRDAEFPIMTNGSYALATFLLEYHGAGNHQGGQMISDGRRFAYVVDRWVWDTLVEGACPNLHCRSLIRRAIRAYVDAMELWPE